MAAFIDSVMQNSTTQTVSVSGTSAATANAINGSGPYAIVEIYAPMLCHMVEGSAPTATTNNAPIPPGQLITKKIASGNKLAFIKASGAADGTVYVTQQA